MKPSVRLPPLSNRAMRVILILLWTIVATTFVWLTVRQMLLTPFLRVRRSSYDIRSRTERALDVIRMVRSGTVPRSHCLCVYGDKSVAEAIMEKVQAGASLSEANCSWGEPASYGEILRWITNQHIGDDPEQWLTWWSLNKRKCQREWIGEGFRTSLGIKLGSVLSETNALALLPLLEPNAQAPDHEVFNEYRVLRNARFPLFRKTSRSPCYAEEYVLTTGIVNSCVSGALLEYTARLTGEYYRDLGIAGYWPECYGRDIVGGYVYPGIRGGYVYLAGRLVRSPTWWKRLVLLVFRRNSHAGILLIVVFLWALWYAWRGQPEQFAYLIVIYAMVGAYIVCQPIVEYGRRYTPCDRLPMAGIPLDACGLAVIMTVLTLPAWFLLVVRTSSEKRFCLPGNISSLLFVVADIVLLMTLFV